MKVFKTRRVLEEIGELDQTTRLPMSSRIAAGMKTNCDACGKPITDEYFVAGFKTGHATLKLHESCVDGREA